MNKIYKFWELIKEMANEKIKKGTKIKIGKDVFEFDGTNFVDKNSDSLYFYMGGYNDLDISKMEFELIGDGIDNIEELNDTCYDECSMMKEDIEFYHNATRTKINEIIQALKQLNERLKKLEE